MNIISPSRGRAWRSGPRGLARLFIALIVSSLLGLPAIVRADDAPKPADSKKGAEPHIPEFFEMLGCLLRKGADMGPSDGWFHPSQSRYGWDWLAARDKDKDGEITPEELGAPPELFRRLDRDHDGAVTKDDLDWSDRSPYLRGRSMARGRFFMIDRNSNGKISKEEWLAIFERASKGKSGITADDLADAFYTPPPRPRKPKEPPKGAKPEDDGPSRWTLLKGLVQGELGSASEGPNIGDMAPDFFLKTHDGKGVVTLSEFRGRKPVVLVFGSFT